MPRQKVSKEIEELVISLRDSGWSYIDIEKEHQIPRATAYRIYHRKSLERQELDGKTLWDNIKASQDKVKPNNYVISRKFDIKKPIMITFIGDIHLGDGCDIKALERDTEFIANLENCYVFDLGDAVDNFIKPSLSHLNMNMKITIREQWELYEHWLRMLGPDKLIGSISGNHERWTTKYAGLDVKEKLLKYNDINVYADNELTIKLQLNHVHYTIHGTHTFRVNSYLNQSHSAKQKIRYNGLVDIDVIGMADKHVPLISMEEVLGKCVTIVRPASYKVYDSYAVELGFTQPNYHRTPTVVLSHWMKDIVVFPTVYHASKYAKVC